MLIKRITDGSLVEDITQSFADQPQSNDVLTLKYNEYKDKASNILEWYAWKIISFVLRKRNKYSNSLNNFPRWISSKIEPHFTVRR